MLMVFLFRGFMESSYKKRILFVGMPDMALVVFKKLMEKRFNIVGIVPPAKADSTYTTMQKIAEHFNIPLFSYDNINDTKFLKTLKKLKADIGIVCSFNKKLPSEFLKTTKDGYLNCHPSLLPNYRGGNPYSAVITNDEEYTGVTIHFMDNNFDTGDIVFQMRVKIDSNETMGTLFNKLNYNCAYAIETVLDKYEKDGFLPSQPQPEGEFVKAPNFLPNSYPTFINWNNSAKKIEAQIRALNPFILASTIFRHQVIKIHSCEYEIKRTNLDPGVVGDLTNGFGITCADGIIHIKSLQMGTYIITDGQDFVKRFSPKIGEKIG